MIDPVAFQIGPIQVHWYGIIIAGAVFIAGLLGTRVARWLNEDPDDGWSMLLLVMVLAVIGARLYHVIHLWDYYSANPVLIIADLERRPRDPRRRGRRRARNPHLDADAGLNTARWMDIFAPALLLGQVIGRLGNYVNQELYGPPISECGNGLPALPAVGHPDRRRAPCRHAVGRPGRVPGRDDAVRAALRLRDGAQPHRHAACSCSSSGASRPRLFAGDAVLMYLMWYGAVRTLLETYRVNNWMILGLPTAMWIGILAFVLAGAWLIIRHRRGRGSPMIRPADEPRPMPTPPAPAAAAGGERWLTGRASCPT